MNNWDIINKHNLSEDEYKQLYKALIVEETYPIPFSKNFIDEMIIRLKNDSKSGKSNIMYCQMQFKYKRILNIDVDKSIYDQTVISAKIGNNAHMIYNKVWDNIDIYKIRNFKYFEEILKYFYEKCINKIPNSEIALSVYKYLFKEYAEYEAFRIMNIINEIGNNSMANEYILPCYRELPLFNASSNQKGIIDVIHLLSNDSYALTDYKTGKPKYFFEHYDNKDNNIITPLKWDKESIRYEISEYFNLLNGDVYKVIENGKNMISFDPPLIEYGRVLYIRDWVNTIKYIPITKEILTISEKYHSRKVECINKGYFYRRISSNCPLYCEYYRICRNSLKYKNKFKEQEKIFKPAFGYFMS